MKQSKSIFPAEMTNVVEQLRGCCPVLGAPRQVSAAEVLAVGFAKDTCQKGNENNEPRKRRHAPGKVML